MNKREFVFNRLNDSLSLNALVGNRIYSTVKGDPGKPFIVIRFDPVFPDVVGGEFQNMTIWVHDQSQSYERIDTILPLIRAALEGPVAMAGETGIHVDWSGESGDLSDDARGTILRNATFRLAGRREA